MIANDDIPESGAEFVSWLEESLTTMDASDELTRTSAMDAGEAALKRPSLAELLGESLVDVFENGFRVLTAPQLVALRTQVRSNPELLLDLREAICLHGGTYWDERLYLPIEKMPSAFREVVSTAEMRIRSRIATGSSRTTAAADAEKSKRQPKYQTPLDRRFLYAAAVIVVLFVPMMLIASWYESSYQRHIASMQAAKRSEIDELEDNLRKSGAQIALLTEQRNASDATIKTLSAQLATTEMKYNPSFKSRSPSSPCNTSKWKKSTPVCCRARSPKLLNWKRRSSWRKGTA